MRDSSVSLLRDIRAQSGKTWEQLEELFHLSPGTLSRYASGKRVLGRTLYPRVLYGYLRFVDVPLKLKQATLAGVHIPVLRSVLNQAYKIKQLTKKALELERLLEDGRREQEFAKWLEEFAQMWPELLHPSRAAKGRRSSHAAAKAERS